MKLPLLQIVCEKQNKTKQNKNLFLHSNMFLRRKKDKHTSMFVRSNHCIWWWNHILEEGEATSYHIFLQRHEIVTYAGVKVGRNYPMKQSLSISFPGELCL